MQVRRVVHAGAALDLDEMLGFQEVEDGLQDLGERKAEDVRKILRARLTLLVQQLEGEVGDEHGRETGLFECARRERRRVL